MKRISIVTPCYNEAENVETLYNQVKDVFSKLPDYDFEYIFIDNASKDRTVPILKEIARKDKRVKIIVNSRNFGPIRSPHHGFLQATGDACISIVADLQDPPSMIVDFIKKWEEGYQRVIGVKKRSDTPLLLAIFRRLFYYVINKLSDTEQIQNATGFGLYDKRIVDILREIDDPYPYFRGLVSDIGFEVATIEYHQPARKKGVTKHNFYSLYDYAMLGITNHSKIPLRLATMLGFAFAIINLLVAFVYFFYKIIYWDRFSVGIAPLVIGVFFMFSVVLFFIGILGEYIGSIYTQVLKRPLVVEKERINF